MPIVFFEGFNYSNSDTIKLDPKYWSFNNPIAFGAGGKTGNAIFLTNRPSTSGLFLNSTLTLSNFTDPLSIGSGVGIGFSLLNRIKTNRTDTSLAPHNENLISFYDNSNAEVLRLDIVKTSGVTYGDSLGIGIYQNSTLVDIYDFKSHIGYTWFIANSAFGSNLINNYVTFLEVYINAKNQQKISIKFTGNTTYDAPLRNNNNQVETTITGFDSLKSIKFYGSHDIADLTQGIDDLYISAGNSASEALLGQNTKIYRVGFNQNFSPIQWSAHDGSNSSQYFYLNSNDGDNSYAFSSTSGNISIFELNNLSSTPNNVGGIKINNIARSSNLASGWKMVNVLSSGGTIIDDTKTHEIISTTYTNNDTFIFTNPITGSGWTLSDINNLKIGIKNLGAYSP